MWAFRKIRCKIADDQSFEETDVTGPLHTAYQRVQRLIGDFDDRELGQILGA